MCALITRSSVCSLTKQWGGTTISKPGISQMEPPFINVQLSKQQLMLATPKFGINQDNKIYQLCLV